MVLLQVVCGRMTKGIREVINSNLEYCKKNDYKMVLISNSKVAGVDEHIKVSDYTRSMRDAITHSMDSYIANTTRGNDIRNSIISYDYMSHNDDVLYVRSGIEMISPINMVSAASSIYDGVDGEPLRSQDVVYNSKYSKNFYECSDRLDMISAPVKVLINIVKHDIPFKTLHKTIDFR